MLGRSKVKFTKVLNAVTEKQPHIRNGKPYIRPLNLAHGWSTTIHIIDMRGDLKGQRLRQYGHKLKQVQFRSRATAGGATWRINLQILV